MVPDEKDTRPGQKATRVIVVGGYRGTIAHGAAIRAAMKMAAIACNAWLRPLSFGGDGPPLELIADKQFKRLALVKHSMVRSFPPMWSSRLGRRRSHSAGQVAKAHVKGTC